MGLFSKSNQADDDAVMSSAIVTLGTALQAVYEGNNREFNANDLWEVLYSACEVLVEDSPEFVVDILKYKYDTRHGNKESEFTFNVKESFNLYSEEMQKLSLDIERYSGFHPNGEEFQKEIPDWFMQQLKLNPKVGDELPIQMYTIGLTLGLRLLASDGLTRDSRTRSRTNLAMAKLLSLCIVSWWDRE
jgi:hypothetical protein